MKNYILLFFVSLIITKSAVAQAPSPDAEGSLVKWMSLEEALAKNQIQAKPILLDFYTSWCGWCKHMMKTTYADPGLAQYINTYFYAAKFNAEGKDTLEYLGKKYGPSSVAPRAPHELTLALLKGNLMYPTTMFLNNFDKTKNEFAVSMMASGFLDRQKIEPILIYNVENIFRSTSYDDFTAQYQRAFYDSTTELQLKKLKWIPAEELFNSTVPKKKKTLVFIYTDWCNSCKVMQRTTFSDTSICTYLGEKFNLVALDAQRVDTLKFKDHEFSNLRTPQAPFHQLALALSRNNLILPTLAVLDEKMDPIDAVSFYIHPNFLRDIAHFYGDDIYKNKSWQDFMIEKQKATPVSVPDQKK